MTAFDHAAGTAPTPGVLALRRAVRHGGLMFGAAVLLLAVLAAFLAPLIAPHDPLSQSLNDRLLPPVWAAEGSWDHVLGTDGLGRDYLSRLIYGTRISLAVGFATMLVSGAIGTTLGFIGGYFGGRADDVVMYLINSRLSMPGLLVALAVISLVGGSLLTIILVLGLLFWDRYAVVVRTATQQARGSDYIAAARAAGASAPWIIWHELRPNVAHNILVVATLEMAMAVLAEASLSFLGLGIRAPTPSWGLMVAEGRDFLFYKPHLVAIPGLAIFVLVLAINLVGDGIRDVTAPEGGR